MSVVDQADEVPWKPKHNPWAIAVVVTLAAFMEVLDATIVNVALPHIAGSLSSTNDEAAWVANFLPRRQWHRVDDFWLAERGDRAQSAIF